MVLKMPFVVCFGCISLIPKYSKEKQKKDEESRK